MNRSIRLDISQAKMYEELSTYSFINKIAAKMESDFSDLVISTIIEEAKLAGVTDLAILDREFIISAILEKMEREGL